MYDKFEALATESSVAVSVLGNADVTDIELLPVRPKALGAEKIQELAARWAARGLRFVGAIGIVDGKPRTALAESLDDRRIAALSQAFIAHCEALLSDNVEQQRKGDEVAWLEDLYRLKDNRPNA